MTRLPFPWRRQRLGRVLALAGLMITLIAGSFGLGHQGPGTAARADGREALEIIRTIDPSCEDYGRCDASFQSSYGGITIRSLNESLNDPDVFTVSGNITFTWNPAAYPGWSPQQLSIACRTKDCDFPGWSLVQSFNKDHARIWSANFNVEAKETTSLAYYPFDQHWVHLKLVSMDDQSQQFLDYLNVASFDIDISQRVLNGESSNFYINYGTISSSIEPLNNDFEATNTSEPLPMPSRISRAGNLSTADQFSDKTRLLDSSSFIVSLQIARRTPAALWMVIIPMGLILLNTNLAFHWRENSPASRFGSSGLLTAVSLFFASRVFRPDVDYLVFTDIWFLVTFITITINNILLIWLFRFYKHRKELKAQGLTIKPAFFAENSLTICSSLFITLIVVLLLITAARLSQPPEIPSAFLAGNSGYAPIGASATKVMDRDSLSSDQGGFLPYRP